MRREHIQKIMDLGLWLEGSGAITAIKNNASVMALMRLMRNGPDVDEAQLREWVALAHKDVDEGGDGV